MGTTRAGKEQIRRLTQNSSGTSSVSIPVEHVRVLGWRKGQRVKLARRGKQLIVKAVS